VPLVSGHYNCIARSMRHTDWNYNLFYC